jgi:hypothetical protein
MILYHLPIPVPALVMRILFAPLLLYRQKKFGRPFMRIKLTQNQFALVDFDDFCRLIRFKWYAHDNGSTFYAERPEYINGFLCRIRMHRVIMNAQKDIVIDHIDRNGLNNCKCNLRPATRTQNKWNSRRGFNTGTSKYKGVFMDRRRGKYRAVLSIDGKRKHLGYFNDELDAAKAYDTAAKLHRGQFAALNFG